MVAVPAEGRDGAVHAPEGGDGVWAEQRGGGQHQQPPPPHHLPLLPGHPAHPDHLPGAAGNMQTIILDRYIIKTTVFVNPHLLSTELSVFRMLRSGLTIS